MVIFTNEEIQVNLKYHFVLVIKFLNYSVSAYKTLVKLVYIYILYYLKIH